MKRTTIGTVLATGLLAAGCGFGGDEGQQRDSGPRETGSRPAEGAGGEPPPQSPGTDTGAETQPEPPREGDRVIASRDGQVDEKPVRLEIVELRRSGGTSALTFRLSRQDGGAGSPTNRAQISTTFDDGLGEINGGKGQDSFTLDGVSLIDAANRKRYLVARDSQGICVCDGDLAGTFVEEGAPVLLSATFGAPPPDVRSADVVIPKFGTFKNVPLS